MRSYWDDNGQAQAEDAPASPAAEAGDRSLSPLQDARRLPPAAREISGVLRAGGTRARKAFQSTRRRLRFRAPAESPDAGQRLAGARSQAIHDIAALRLIARD